LIASFLFRSNLKKHTIIDKNPAKQSQSLQHHIAVSPNLMVSIKILHTVIRKDSKGSHKNKFTFLGVEAPAWQGAKAQEHRDISSFRNAARQDSSAHKNVKLFLREP
jgi:hypothetical protein